MFYKSYTLTALLLTPLLFSACGNNEKDKQVAYGKQLFEQREIGFVKAPGCVLCHSLIKDFKLAGPSLYNIGKRAAKVKENMTAKEYIEESILNPSAYVVDGYRHDVMYPHYENDLEPEELESLVQFLLTQ